MSKKYWKKLKISGPNGLSKCPESIEMDFGPFWENIFRPFFDDFLDQHFSKNGPQKGPLAQVPG